MLKLVHDRDKQNVFAKEADELAVKLVATAIASTSDSHVVRAALMRVFGDVTTDVFVKNESSRGSIIKETKSYVDIVRHLVEHMEANR